VKRLLRAIPFVAALSVLLSALYLVSSVEQESTQLGRLNLSVFVATAVALVVLAGVILGRLVSLVGSVRKRRPGARLTARLVWVFLALALPPVLVVYLFSVEFIGETIEGWFDVETEQALADSMEMGRVFIDIRTREVRGQTRRVARAAGGVEDELLFGELVGRVSSAGPVELSVFDTSGQNLAFAHIDSTELLPDLPSGFALSQASRGDVYADVEPVGDTGLQIRVLHPVPAGRPGQTGRILQAIYPLPEDFSRLAQSVEEAHHRYGNVAYLRERLEQSFILILSLVLLLTGLLAMLLALNAARRLVAPVRDLAEATEEMTAGRFPRELDVSSRDELGFLVRSFNLMTRELASSQQQLEAQRHYLETVLSRLSAGVIATDENGRLAAWNPSAGEILGVDLDGFRDQPLEALASQRRDLEPLVASIRERMREGAREWRREIKLGTPEDPLVLVCRGSVLPVGDGQGRGHVVVFDDVTVLDQAQREAAWAEVARRLAHEVKNPLTPIRLATERLQLKLAPELQGASRALLDKSTRTIVSQVDALKRLVNAFGDYAHAPGMRPEPVNINDLIEEVTDLYASAGDRIEFVTRLEAGNDRIRADSDMLRQLLHNLIRNAQEAHPEGRPEMRISTRQTDRSGEHWLELEITDNGPGFSEEVLGHLFEPYVTTKNRGTGLGLPIVRRIVEQHGGEIEACNGQDGARIRIWLPVPTSDMLSHPRYKSSSE